jgi:hypothetical protein
MNSTATPEATAHADVSAALWAVHKVCVEIARSGALLLTFNLA